MNIQPITVSYNTLPFQRRKASTDFTQNTQNYGNQNLEHDVFTNSVQTQKGTSALDIYGCNIVQMQRNIQNTYLKKIFNNEYNNLPPIPNEEDKMSLSLISYLDSTIKLVKDEKINQYIDKTLNYLCSDKFKDADTSSYNEELTYLKYVVDAYNELNGNYVTLKIYNYYNDDTIGICNSAIYDYLQSRIKNPLHKTMFFQLINDENNHSLMQDFIDAQKTNALFEICSDEEIGEYIYNNYYLPNIKINKREKELLNLINKKFGTKVIISSHANNLEQILNYILLELDAWKNTGKGREILPYCIDLNTSKKEYLQEPPANGAACISNCSIIIDGSYTRNLEQVLRHEIAHLNDKYVDSEYPVPPDIKYLENKIMPKYTVEKDGELYYVTDFNKCLYREEFLKLGLKPQEIKHAYSKREELIAFASEFQTSDFSPEFKEILIKLGLPEFVFNIPKQSKISSLSK